VGKRKFAAFLEGYRGSIETPDRQCPTAQAALDHRRAALRRAERFAMIITRSPAAASPLGGGGNRSSVILSRSTGAFWVAAAIDRYVSTSPFHQNIRRRVHHQVFKMETSLRSIDDIRSSIIREAFAPSPAHRGASARKIASMFGYSQPGAGSAHRGVSTTAPPRRAFPTPLNQRKIRCPKSRLAEEGRATIELDVSPVSRNRESRISSIGRVW